MVSEDLREVVIDVVMTLDSLGRQEDVAAEIAEALYIDLRSEWIVGEIPAPSVAVLQLQFVEGGRAELVVVRGHDAAVKSRELAAARDGRQGSSRLVFKIGVGQVEAQIAAAPFTEIVVDPRRKLGLRFVERELPAGAVEELDGSGKVGRRKSASQPGR